MKETYKVTLPKKIVFGDPLYFEEFKGKKLGSLVVDFSPPRHFEATVVLQEVPFDEFPDVMDRTMTICPSSYYSEERIYDALATMVNKLRFGDEDIIGQIITKLENAVYEHKRNNKAASSVSQSIAEINAKILMLDQLRSKGYLAPEVHQAQTIDLRNQLSKLKTERTDLFETRILEMLEEVKNLRALLQEIECPLERIDEKLLVEIVTSMEINKHDEMAVTVLGGLTFRELL